MTLNDIKKELKSEKYSFLKNAKQLGDNIQLLCVTGDHAYGIETLESDLDIIECTLNSEQETLLGCRLGSTENDTTDTVIYSFIKFINLMIQGDPNLVEVLGLKPEHYLYTGSYGKDILQLKHMFLTQQLYVSFYVYAGSILKNANDLYKKLQLWKNESNITIQHVKSALCKNLMHNIRIYAMLLDILEGQENFTYRKQEHDLLMDIMVGKYFNENFGLKPEYIDIEHDYKNKIEYAFKNTNLPEQPNIEKINEFIMYVNEKVIKAH